MTGMGRNHKKFGWPLGKRGLLCIRQNGNSRDP